MIKKIFISILKEIISLNYYICLFIAISSILLYIFNFKKAGKWIPFSVGLFILLQAIGAALK